MNIVLPFQALRAVRFLCTRAHQQQYRQFVQYASPVGCQVVEIWISVRGVRRDFAIWMSCV